MRFALTFLFLLPVSSFAATQSLEDCRVYRVVDPTVFSESLSTNEYPSIDVNRTDKGLEVSVGGSGDWEQAEGDFISARQGEKGSRQYVFRHRDRSQAFVLVITPNEHGYRRAKLSVKDGGEPLSTVALAYCK